MLWKVIFTEDFHLWIDSQPEALRNKLAAELVNIGFWGPHMGRPQVDTVKGSRFSNMKELRVQWCGKPYRLFFAFDPLQRAVVLCGGDKTGRKRFYDRLIRIADEQFTRHLAKIGGENDNVR